MYISEFVLSFQLKKIPVHSCIIFILFVFVDLSSVHITLAIQLHTTTLVTAYVSCYHNVSVCSHQTHKISVKNHTLDLSNEPINLIKDKKKS